MISDTTQNIPSWKDTLAQDKQEPYFQKILAYLQARRAENVIIYPPQKDIFNAFRLTPLEKVKVVILGQDPYHGPGQAHGLCFSVHQVEPPPPSLKNIFKELHNDLGLPISQHGCLESWAKQGVFLLNTVLTVEAGQAHSHADIGWETFTDRVIQVLNEKRKGLIFLLWGSAAQSKGRWIDPTRHFILKTTHPSPLSAHRGFLGCRHFSKTNTLLERQGLTAIDWSL